MKRAALILLLGAALAVLGGIGVYLARTATDRAMLCCQKPELAWLQHEFQMSDDQLARVQKLDVTYQAGCAEMCRRISATNELVRLQFIRQPAASPEMERLLAGAAQLRVECQFNLLQYGYAVSREMPAPSGQRYLQWVSDQVLAMPRDSSMQNPNQSMHGN